MSKKDAYISIALKKCTRLLEFLKMDLSQRPQKC